MKKYLMPTLITLIVIALMTSCKEKIEIKSPSQGISFSLQLKDGELFYTIAKNQEKVILPSHLGLELLDNSDFSNNLAITSYETQSIDTNWEATWGQNKKIHNHYNELNITLKNQEELYFTFQVRVYDDGVGFRYIIPKQKGIDSLQITNEKTEFHLAQDGKAWTTPANFDSYELLYKTTKISEVKDANTPATFQLDNGIYICIHEANLTDYAEMTLKQENNTSFSANLVPWPDGIKVRRNKSLTSPWRTLIITDNAMEIPVSNLIQNLNEPCKIKNTQWIKPMKYIGIWWGMHLGINTWTIGNKHGATTENMKKYIDFATENNIKGVLAEGWNTGWENWGKPKAFDQTTPYADYDLEEIVKYAKEKKIELIAHHETGGDFIYYEERMEEAFKDLYKKGIHVLKTGYAGGISGGYYHHSQRMVQHYRKVVELAAKYKLMLDVHEPIKPTGISRTYPNMMTREGARGMEWNAWSEGNPPEHHVILPFTRCVGGPLDYTPGIFDILYKNRKEYTKWNGNDKGNSRVNTTLAKQLALWVCLYSPLQMASDLVENYQGQKAFTFFQKLNVDFDKTKVLAAQIGDYYAVARKTGKVWYIGAITDENPRTIQLNLSFLDKHKKYNAEIYSDNKETSLNTNPTALSINNKIVDNTTTLDIQMKEGGGQAIILTEIEE